MAANDPAFPAVGEIVTIGDVDMFKPFVQGGLTKRQLLAALILAGIAARNTIDDRDVHYATVMADELLKQTGDA